MIYNSLKTLPVVLFYEIVETGNVMLLDSEGKSNEDDMVELWTGLHNEFLEIDDSNEFKRILRLKSDIDFYELKYQYILFACEALAFDWNEEIVAQLKKWGYKITAENYYGDIEQVIREANGLKIKANMLRSQLPKDKEDEKNRKVEEVLASYSLILGFDVGDYNTVSAMKFLSLKKSVNAKVESLKEQERKTKAKKR